MTSMIYASNFLILVTFLAILLLLGWVAFQPQETSLVHSQLNSTELLTINHGRCIFDTSFVRVTRLMMVL